MRLLLDTHVYIWFLADAKALTREARTVIAEAESVWVSAVSVWEATIKIAMGKLRSEPSDLLGGIAASGFGELPVTGAHAARVATLPTIHRDPFDRLLIAQALHEPLHLVTADEVLARYSELVIVV